MQTKSKIAGRSLRGIKQPTDRLQGKNFLSRLALAQTTKSSSPLYSHHTKGGLPCQVAPSPRRSVMRTLNQMRRSLLATAAILTFAAGGMLAAPIGATAGDVKSAMMPAHTSAHAAQPVVD